MITHFPLLFPPLDERLFHILLKKKRVWTLFTTNHVPSHSLPQSSLSFSQRADSLTRDTWAYSFDIRARVELILSSALRFSDSTHACCPLWRDSSGGNSLSQSLPYTCLVKILDLQTDGQCLICFSCLEITSVSSVSFPCKILFLDKFLISSSID